MTQELRNLALDLRFAGRYATETEAEAALRRIKRNQEASFAMESLLDRLEKADKDVARLDWLEQNIFNRENVDWITGEVSKTHNMWVTFAPVGVQGSARRIIDAGMEASK